MATVNDIAKLIDGIVVGDGGVSAKGMAPSDIAEDGDVTFAFSEEELELAAKSKASCVLSMVAPEKYPKTILQVKDMKLAMTILYNAMLQMQPARKGVIHPKAIIDKSAVLGKNVSVGPNSIIERNVKIGDNAEISANCVISEGATIGGKTRLNPNVTIYAHTIIGSGVIIHSGTVIGADGFGYIPKDEKIYKVPQMGKVVIEDGVEVGANTCIDRGTFTDTVIGSGTKIDNLVQIAHNVKVGKNVFIAALVGIAGSSTIGDGAMMGGQSGVSDHLHVGKNVKVAAKTGVLGSVKDGETVFGYPHRKSTETRRLYGILSLILKKSIKFKALLRDFPND